MILLIFIIPGILITLSMQYLLPLLVEYMPMFWAVVICLWGPLILTLIYVLFLWKKSKQPLHEFFRIGKLTKKLLFISLGAFILIQVLELALATTRIPLTQIPMFQPPEVFPEVFSPYFEPSIPLITFMDIELKGNYSMLLLWAFWLVLNIGVEEFLWRGYALPRMEKVYGKYAWLINGLLWNILIHFFMRWSFISLLPISLLLPYIAQKSKSIWPGIIIHGVGNALLYVILVPSIFN